MSEPDIRKKKRGSAVMLILSAVVLGALILSFFLGRYSLSPLGVIKLLGERFFGIPSGFSGSEANVFWGLRLPRVLAAFIVGAGLSVSGCSYQINFRNPMVSPDILGATNGAGLGAALALLLDFSAFGVQLMAFVFGLLAVGGTYLFASLLGGRDSDNLLALVLTGIVMSALFAAGISLIKYVGDPYTKLPAITFWLMGSLSSVVPSSLPMLIIPFALGVIPLFLMRWKINLLTLTDEEALSMGISVRKLRLAVIVCATLITSSGVAVSGIIGWIGLVVPHLVRMMTGSDTKYLIPGSVLLGGAFLLLVDDVARSATSMDIPIGILTAVIGAPFFMVLLYRERKRK